MAWNTPAYRAIHRSILTGLLGNIALYDEEARLYKATQDRKVALFIDHEASQEEILKWADTAMFQAKEAGRNTIRFHDSKD